MYLLLLSLLGCSDHMMSKVVPSDPEIIVHPEHIDFGHLIGSVESAVESFTVINAGEGDLEISSPVLVSGNDRYNLQDVEDSYVISGGEILEFFIEYSPKTFEANGAYIDINSNDEDEPLSRVTIEGYGDAPVMTVFPQDFDYGSITIGCDNEERITIKNTGNMDLQIDEVVQMVTQPADIIMEFGSLPPLPWFLEPEQEIDFLVSYIPTNIGNDESQVSIEGSDPQTPEIITTQVGNGDIEKWFRQQWQQEEIAIIDVLWVVDNSGSMSIFQQNLSSNVAYFVNVFANSGADYRMAVITTDSYSFNHFVSAGDANAEILMSSMILVGLGGSGNEAGIAMAERSLKIGDARPGGDFFRDEANLIIIFVSDERDHSGSWSNYTSFFDTIKPQGKFIPYGVIGDVPNGCSYSNGNILRSADAGLGYWDLIDHYGGSWFSICNSDWGVQLQQLAAEVTSRDTFILDELDPIINTIEVRVNGQITTYWSYDSHLNAVIFDNGHVPNEGQTISIEYAVWGCGG
tara:strand:+ start:4945 stop:6498 length:1554 start_codon:yes stop_codon:yes gene_type:complete